MKIELKTLTLNHFKGAKNLTIEFSHRTSISGMNASGKTRLFDAFTWVNFGVDSEDVKDFNMKSLDKNNEPIHKVDTSVTEILSVDGIDMKLERIYKEKWTKKHGEPTPEFDGHITSFFVNGVPLLLKDYTEKVESILPKSLFKQVTNPAFFNSMKWTDRRAMLFEMAGNVTDKDVIAANKDLQKFYEAITGKSFDEFKRELAAKKKLLKESILNVPARIDEVSRAIVPDPDYSLINVEIDKMNGRIFQIDGLIASDAEKFNALNQENQRKQNRIYEIQKTIDQLKNDDIRGADKAINDLKLKKNGLTSKIDWYKSNAVTLTNNLNLTTNRINQFIESNNKLRADWSVLNEKVLTFDPLETICPVCKRAYDAEIIEETRAKLTTNFNTDRQNKLQSITNIGKDNKIEIDRLTDEVNKIQEQVIDNSDLETKTQAELNSIIIPERPETNQNPQIKVLQDELTMTSNMMTAVVKTDNTELLTEKVEININLDSLKRLLNIKDQNEKLKVRKQELIDSEKSLSQQIADIEKQEFQCEAFTRAKIGMIEDKVNSMFSLVKFKMFNILVNGGSEETCDCLINGVPYSDANNAAKIQGGLDIIKTLSKHYDVYAPVFIDNRESVTEIPDMDCQVISLYVDPEQKTLLVKNYEEVIEDVAAKN